MNLIAYALFLIPTLISYLLDHNQDQSFSEWFHSHSEINFTMTGTAFAFVITDESFFTMQDVHDLLFVVIKVIVGSIVGYSMGKFYQYVDRVKAERKKNRQK